MPYLSAAMDGKHALFQQLKPPCVALGQVALALNGKQNSVQSAVDHLKTIQLMLSSSSQNESRVLDAKLAEYVFFPIAQLLKVSQKLSIRCLELSIQCMAILLEEGWRQDVPPKLAAQIIILCSLLAEKKPSGLSFSQTTDELQASSFWCLYSLFSVAGRSAETRAILTSEPNFPQLGQTVSVILDGIHDSGSTETQIAATSALHALVKDVVDREIQASFLPGIASKLTLVLTPQTKLRRNHKVLVECLDILSILLTATMGDLLLQGPQDGRLTLGKQSVVDAQWQETAALQLKPGLSKILRLTAHSRGDIKTAVSGLCVTILRDCRKTLANCSRLALEALVKMSSGSTESSAARKIGQLVHEDLSMIAKLQDMLYDWLRSLTTVMQSADEQAKTAKLEQITVVYEIMVHAGADLSSMNGVLAAALRDSVVVTLTAPGIRQSPTPHASEIQPLDLVLKEDQSSGVEFASPLVRHRGQEENMQELAKLTRSISSSEGSDNFSSEFARCLRHSQGVIQISNLWLLLIATRTALHGTVDVDDFLDLETGSRTVYHEFLEEIYSFSLSVLTAPSDEPADPRLQALALRGLALRAQTIGRDFRYELVDALYPVLHTLATPDHHLQRDVITTLNVFTSACGYASVKELVVHNVDYLTNAVALKLNAFDVSPQAPQVLLMMVRLAGPTLLPYLEDTIESIFAALEDYHGYPLLVELLFKVLGVIAEEGVKAPQLTVLDGKSEDPAFVMLETWEPTNVEDLTILLRQCTSDEANANKVETEIEKREAYPSQPWTSNEEVTDHDSDSEGPDDSQLEHGLDDNDQPPPAPKTYSLLLKITELTQHFLPSASPSLRTSLLSLIRTTVPAIAQHQNSFLPLINTLWPEIVARLDDEEPYIVATALELVGILCQYAGDFMNTRIIQLWPALRDIYQSTAINIHNSSSNRNETQARSKPKNTATVPRNMHLAEAVSRMDHAHPVYGDTASCALWNALVSTISAVLSNVQVSPDMVDEAFQMLGAVMQQANVRSTLAKVNADAVWLAGVRTGALPKPTLPRTSNNPIWQFAVVAG
ncbi:hypothetical protein LTR37_017577 [Vermiconidia calcicola]|uniref:Uncharacterized protein n=1 Tax=Vermiconidia calcicola TaxID=1690605 RepID=A0ACC3ML78_9PEZI|nr:hypothetical protein LTR37_017577 [Vermiconidia calcicola]